MTAPMPFEALARAAVVSIAADAREDRAAQVERSGRKAPMFLMVEIDARGRCGWWWRPAALAGSREARAMAAQVDDYVVVEAISAAPAVDPSKPESWRLPRASFRLSEVAP